MEVLQKERVEEPAHRRTCETSKARQLPRENPQRAPVDDSGSSLAMYF